MLAPVRSYNRLALRLAAVVGVAAVAAVAVALWLPLGPVGQAVVVAVVGAASAYAAAHAFVARRLELARQTLREARKRRFEALANLQRGPARDELDDLMYQVYRAGRALQEEIERLETLENYRREFLGDVSHELRTPIFAVSGFAESLLDGALDDERVRRRFVEKILANAHRLDALTRDLAEISRIETGDLQMTMEPFDLQGLVVEAVESLEKLARTRGVHLGLDLPSPVPRAVGDRDRLRQVLTNLVENAIEYNEPGGRVTVAVERLEGVGGAPPRLHVAVGDDGIGIPEALIPRLTERFFRVDKSRSRAQGGTGLGLAIVKHILEAHGQRLRIESRPGAGSTFAFRLPEAEPREAKRRLVLREAPAAPAGSD
ncbi:MAG: ATP-binding protein [Rubricoccaceae bacterium]|nr:ATP-binding protein [Rubricoccaceae bacterium]